MILLLIYCKEYAKIHDRTQKDKAMGAAFKFWRDTWPEDFTYSRGRQLNLYKCHLITEDKKVKKDIDAVWSEFLVFWETEAKLKKLSKTRVDELYRLRDEVRTYQRVPDNLRQMAEEKGLKIWHSNKWDKLSGFRIQKDRRVLAGREFDLTAEEAIDFVKKYRLSES